MPNLKTILVVAALGGGIYSAARLMPPYFNNYQFQDDLASISKFDAPAAKSDDDIRAAVLKKAATYELPLTEDQINVSHAEGGKVVIQVAYTVAVNLLPNKTVVLRFADSSEKGSAASSK